LEFFADLEGFYEPVYGLGLVAGRAKVAIEFEFCHFLAAYRVFETLYFTLKYGEIQGKESQA